MKIAIDHPPNYAAIAAAFNLDGRRGVLFCYGDTIFNPDGVTIPPQLIAHEEVHCRQQGSLIKEWWRAYIESPIFRLAQELPAHQAEYNAFCRSPLTPSRVDRRLYLTSASRRLSGPLYGNLISLDRARSLIRGGCDG